MAQHRLEQSSSPDSSITPGRFCFSCERSVRFIPHRTQVSRCPLLWLRFFHVCGIDRLRSVDAHCCGSGFAMCGIDSASHSWISFWQTLGWIILTGENGWDTAPITAIDKLTFTNPCICLCSLINRISPEELHLLSHRKQLNHFVVWITEIETNAK